MDDTAYDADESTEVVDIDEKIEAEGIYSNSNPRVNNTTELGLGEEIDKQETKELID